MHRSALVLITSAFAALGLAACSGDPVRPGPAPTRQPGPATASLSATPRVIQISAAGNHTCALKSDGEVVCWGRAADYANVAPPAGPFTQIDAGWNVNCALRPDGTIACWGDNTWNEATIPDGLTGVVQVSVGPGIACVRKSDGTIACWPPPASNIMGPIYLPPPGLTDIVHVTMGGAQGCAVKADGTIACWPSWIVPPAGLTGVAQVTASDNGYSCAVRNDGTVVCWGNNGNGQTSVPADLAGVVQVATGGLHVCAAKGDGAVACWGERGNGGAGVPPANLSGVVQVAAGFAHTCALKGDGGIVCWGQNGFGQLDVPASLLNGPPAVSPGGPYSGAEGSAVTLAWGATDPDGDALAYSWSFGDGTTGSGASLPATHVYADNGSYTITVTATDPAGASDTKTATATIANVAPSVAVTAEPGPYAQGVAIDFPYTVNDPGTLDSPWQLTIDYGDGQTFAGPALGINGANGTCPTHCLTHAYAYAGTYTLRFTVTDKDGGTSSASVTVVVPPIAVEIDIKPGADPNSISLTDAGGGQIPVAILTTPTFDARLIAPATVQLGATAVSARRNGSLFASLQDVDGDGDTDLLVHFDRGLLIANGDLTPTTTSLALIADLALPDGRQIAGTDGVRIVNGQ